MALVLLDTNVLIDHFNGVGAATIEIANHQDLAISAITWMEVAVGLDGSDLAAFESMVDELPIRVLHTNDEIIRETARLRAASIAAYKAGAGKKLATPDAVILATANHTNRQLVTGNPADFSAASVPIRIPYKLVDGIASDIAPWP